MEKSAELQTTELHFKHSLFKSSVQVIIDIVFSLHMKDARIGCSLSRSVLDCKVSVAFTMFVLLVCLVLS